MLAWRNFSSDGGAFHFLLLLFLVKERCWPEGEKRESGVCVCVGVGLFRGRVCFASSEGGREEEEGGAMVQAGGAPVVASAPTACQVQCAGCRRILNVPSGILNFQCPKCKLPQVLPPQLRSQGLARGIDNTKIQLPCANCRAVLNVPPGLTRFVCPQCRVELAVDPVKLAAYMSSLSQLNALGNGHGAPPTVSAGGLPGDAMDDTGWNSKQLHGASGFSMEEINEVALEVEQEEDEAGTIGDTFTDYKPSKLSIGQPHPDPIVETASLSAVQPPEPTYDLLIAEEMEKSGALSCLQLETIVYASQRHMQHLADNSRAGFFLGDGAGVGKGRTIAGLIWENWKRGRTKALWLSVGSDLKFDARRDLDDVGAMPVEVHALNKLPYAKLDSKTVGVKEGVLFLTYSSLIASSEKGRSRLNQLVQWCGPDFDGLLVFDECHKAKNLVPEAGGQATRTGEAVLEIQNKMPDARVVYCSATGASEPRNMGYMARLGLWGSGTDFPQFSSFLGALEKRGVGALELVAMDMKTRGMYVCRTLSFKGADFSIDEVPLENRMQNMYLQACFFWSSLRVELMAALDALTEKKPSQNQLWRLYWANHQRFFRHMCMSAKVPAAVRLAKQALEEEKCVVIGLQSTGEARTEEAVNKYGVELDDFVSGPRELLLKLVEEHYPLPQDPKLVGAESDPDSTMSEEEIRACHICMAEDASQQFLECTSCRTAVHPACLSPPLTENSDCDWYCVGCGQKTCDFQVEKRRFVSVVSARYEEAKSRKSKILDTIRSLELPNNPLDDIIDQLGGPDRVAEMTGRRGMLVRAKSGTGVVYQARNTKDVTLEMINMHEKQQFMDGKKFVAVISEAASAGVSLQADRRALNQRRRVHVTLELPWSADRAIQQFGRTHRSNQASAPQYRLLFTNLGGERRFASIVAKRLETLGALTQGDRRAGPSLSAFNYDSVYGKKALASTYKSLMEQAEPLVIPPGCPSGDSAKIKEFFHLCRQALLTVGIIRDAVGVNQNNGTIKSSTRPSGRIAEADLHDVGRFLNRALGLPPDIQNRLFEFFVSVFDELIRDARKEGQFDSGIVDIKASTIELNGSPKTVHVDNISGAPTTLFVLETDRGLTWEAANKLHEDHADGVDNGIYRSKREWLGRTHYLLALERSGSSPKAFRVFRPASGEAPREMSFTELRSKYTKVSSSDQAKAGWTEDFTISADQCLHGPKCKMGSSCTIGRRVQQVHILGGLILPVWGTVEKALSKQVRKSHKRLRVVRVETTTEGRRIVGLHIPNTAVDAVLTGLNDLQVKGLEDSIG
ncbi:hypothetical protein KC19_1G074000 [Ceratodon purpureus]|uniref:PHD-type domain-containing protein n=1 Tax=Ceratodon purpureus TaxID=3225 RepID=A0A8T0J3J1_CERPU|nr:hypothetical protein KC19_1G074000 [Ceratodon purpureus]